MKLLIKDLEWDIEWADQDISDNSEYTCGVTYRSKLLMLLNKHLPDTLVLRTIDHELTHMYLWSYGWVKSSFSEEDMANFNECHSREKIEMANIIYKEMMPKKNQNTTHTIVDDFSSQEKK